MLILGQTHGRVYPEISDYFIFIATFPVKVSVLSLQVCRHFAKERTCTIQVHTLCFGANRSRNRRPKIQSALLWSRHVTSIQQEKVRALDFINFDSHIAESYSHPLPWTGKDLLGHHV